MVWKQLQTDKFILCLFRAVGIYAVPVFALNAYVDYKVFILFGANLHAFTNFTIYDITFYLFCFGLSYGSIKKFYPILWLSPIFAFTTLRNSIPYFYTLIVHPNTITMPFLTFLAILNSVFVLLSLFTWLLWLKKYLTNRAI